MRDARRQFGNTVRTIRLEVGVSQEGLADEAGLHRTYIGAVERGETNISLLNLIRIAKALRVHPTRLLKDLD